MTPARPGAEEICDWCCEHAASILSRPRERIDPDAKMSRLGLDSATSVHLMMALEDWLGIELSPELALEHPTLRALSEHVAGLVARSN